MQLINRFSIKPPIRIWRIQKQIIASWFPWSDALPMGSGTPTSSPVSLGGAGPWKPLTPTRSSGIKGARNRRTLHPPPHPRACDWRAAPVSSLPRSPKPVTAIECGLCAHKGGHHSWFGKLSDQPIQYIEVIDPQLFSMKYPNQISGHPLCLLSTSPFSIQEQYQFLE